jgi:hypothetical protein
MPGSATARASLVLGLVTAAIAASSAMAVWQAHPWPTPYAAFGCVAVVVLSSYGWAWFLGWQGWGDSGAPGMTAAMMAATALLIGHATYRALAGTALAGQHALAVVGGGGVGLLIIGYAAGWALAQARSERSARAARGLAGKGLGRSALIAALLAAVATASGLAVASSTFVRDRDHGSYQTLVELPPMAESGGRFSEERAADATFALGRTCIGHRCLAHITRAGVPRSFGPDFDQGAGVRLLHSPARHLFMLEAGGRALAVGDDAPSAWDWREPSTLDTGRLLSALPGLAAMAAFGLFAAVLALGLRSLVARRLASVRVAREGRVEGGWLRLGDAQPPTRVATSHEGPVLADFGAEGRAAQPYRGDAHEAAPELIMGERDALAHALEKKIDTLDATAVGLATCFSAPLCAAFAAWFWM